MSPLKRLIGELHRRSLWQVLLIYGATSWVVLQVVEVLMEGLGIPGWVFPVALILLLAGLPIVLATAFVQEGGPTLRSEDPTLHPELERLPGDAGAKEAPAEGGGAKTEALEGLFTWRNAVIGGVLAFALLGMAVTGYMAMRIAGIGPVGTLIARGALEERAPIVMAGFEAPASSPELGGVVTQAMRIDLNESPVVTVADAGRISRVLERMGRDPAGATLDEELAREVAVREGLTAVLTGRVSAVGGRYLLSARLVRPDDGGQLVGEQVEAPDSTALLDAIDELSARLRERIGESLKSIRAGEPLERVTTSSLEALRKYSQALEALTAYDQERAIALLEEAVDRDSTFAMAWRKLGVVHANRREMSEAEPAFERAYALRERLGDRERYHTEGIYHFYVTEDLDRAAVAYRSLLDRYPDDTWALNNLSIVLTRQGHDAQAESLLVRAIATGNAGTSEYTNLIARRLDAGRVAGADSALELFAGAYPGHPQIHQYAAGIAYRRGEHGAAEERLRRFLDATAGQPGPQIRGRVTLAYYLAILGRYEEARETLEEAERRMVDAGREGQALEHAATFAVLEHEVLGDTATAAERVEGALARYPLEEIPEADRPYEPLAAFALLRGNVERTRALLSEARGAELTELPPPFASLVARAAGRWERARELLGVEDREGRCDRFCLPVLAEAYAATGAPDSASAAYERFLEGFGDGPVDGLFLDAWWRAAAHEELAELYRETGEPAKAEEEYRKLVALWENADPPLRPRVRRAREALRELEDGPAESESGG